MKNPTEYLGEGVTATHDGWGVRLDLAQQGNPEIKIYLEPQVMRRLKEFIAAASVELQERRLRAAAEIKDD